MYYDKRIRYIDYLENGEKQRNCGYIKITVTGGRLLLEMQIKGLYATDDMASEVVLVGPGLERRIGTVSIRQGSGSFCWEVQDQAHQGEETLLTEELSYGQLMGIAVQLSSRRSLYCRWKEVVASEPAATERTMKGAVREQALRPGETARPEEAVVPGVGAEPKKAEEQGTSAESARAEELAERELKVPLEPGEAVGSENTLEPEGPTGSENTPEPGEPAGTENTLEPGEPAGTENTLEPGESAGAENTLEPGEPAGSENTLKPGEAMEEGGTLRQEESTGRESISKPDESIKEEGLPKSEEPVEPVGQSEQEAWGMKNQLEPEREELHTAETQRTVIHEPPTMPMSEEKWQQLQRIYPHICPFQDEREYLSLRPEDFVILRSNSYRLVQNSFLLHGFYNYKHLILTYVSQRNTGQYYIGVPGNFYEKEKQVAIMYGFDSFECKQEPARDGDFGYYMIRVEL